MAAAAMSARPNRGHEEDGPDCRREATAAAGFGAGELKSSSPDRDRDRGDGTGGGDEGGAAAAAAGMAAAAAGMAEAALSPAHSCASSSRTSVTSAETANSSQAPFSPLLPSLGQSSYAAGGSLGPMETLREEARSEAGVGVGTSDGGGGGGKVDGIWQQPPAANGWGGGGGGAGTREKEGAGLGMWRGQERTQQQVREDADGSKAGSRRRGRSWVERDRTGGHRSEDRDASEAKAAMESPSKLSASASPYAFHSAWPVLQDNNEKTGTFGVGTQEAKAVTIQENIELAQQQEQWGIAQLHGVQAGTKVPPQSLIPGMYPQGRDFYASPGSNAVASPDETSPLSSPELSPHLGPQQPPPTHMAGQLRLLPGMQGHQAPPYHRPHYNQQQMFAGKQQRQIQSHPHPHHQHQHQHHYGPQPNSLAMRPTDQYPAPHQHQPHPQHLPHHNSGGPKAVPQLQHQGYQSHRNQRQPQQGGGAFGTGQPHNRGGGGLMPPNAYQHHRQGPSLSPMRGGYGSASGGHSLSPQIRPRYDRPGGPGPGPGQQAPHQHQHQHQHQHHPPPPQSQQPPHQQAPSSRSAPEVLKTLLRKKACLYEPVTSRAVSLVAWIVGRDLALRRGYFSRQQLQSGVHDVVGSKIASKVVTRTKVNRCLQVVLNSCFHYIIPRPDGTEESGESFRAEFEQSIRGGAGEAEAAMAALPRPWDDLNRCVQAARRKKAAADAKAEAEAEDDQEDTDDDTEGKAPSSSKRAVLLCFNENVRSAAEVHRCHDEFVRDAARSAGLMLGADDWNSFFTGGVGMGDGPTSPVLSPGLQPMVSLAAAAAVAAVSTPTPSWEEEESHPVVAAPSAAITSTVSVPSPESFPQHDVLGCMAPPDLHKFRTTWCAKRYEHDPSLCSFAHVEVNGGWLRRNPAVWVYGVEMCPNVVEDASGGGIMINACPHGLACKMAHSKEEVNYHPDRYKRFTCDQMTPPSPRSAGGVGGQVPCCPLQDVCPFHHPWKWTSHLRPGGGALRGDRGQGRIRGQDRSPLRFGTGGRHPGGTPGGGQRGGRSGGSSLRGKTPPRLRVGVPQQGTGGNVAEVPSAPVPNPSGPPMLYVHPAPESEFDRSLLLPGLRALFRRNCAAAWSHRRDEATRRGQPQSLAPKRGEGGRDSPVVVYSLFGDNQGLAKSDSGMIKLIAD